MQISIEVLNSPLTMERIEKVVNISKLKKPAAVPVNKADLLE